MVNLPIVIEESFVYRGLEELFVVLAPLESLRLLCKYGKVIFYMDGMHGVNKYMFGLLLVVCQLLILSRAGTNNETLP